MLAWAMCCADSRFLAVTFGLQTDTAADSTDKIYSLVAITIKDGPRAAASAAAISVKASESGASAGDEAVRGVRHPLAVPQLEERELEELEVQQPALTGTQSQAGLAIQPEAQ